MRFTASSQITTTTIPAKTIDCEMMSLEGDTFHLIKLPSSPKSYFCKAPLLKIKSLDSRKSCDATLNRWQSIRHCLRLFFPFTNFHEKTRDQKSRFPLLDLFTSAHAYSKFILSVFNSPRLVLCVSYSAFISRNSEKNPSYFVRISFGSFSRSSFDKTRFAIADDDSSDAILTFHVFLTVELLLVLVFSPKFLPWNFFQPIILRKGQAVHRGTMLLNRFES